MSEATSSSRSERSPSLYIEESNPFLALFPHRFDYIWAPVPLPGHPVEWQTETRHPLSDRMIEQGNCLYGVRFGKETNYAMLDIDINSTYHPKRDPFAIRRILESFEEFGITHSLIISSSYSGGIHIYLPFAQAQKCGSLAMAIETLVELKGFKVAPGQLEIFPDPKPYIANSTPQLYNGHRLPLQSGSYLLNGDWEPSYSSQAEFVRRWKFCQEHNEVTNAAIQQILKTYRRRQCRVSAKATKFLHDLHTEIEQGWSDHGQTNRLLGRIALREYIFGHILAGVAPLEGVDLVQQIVKVATALPGYGEWCRHQHEIHKRAEEWARSIERSRYFHYGSKSSTLSTLQPADEEEQPTWNEQQSLTAREKIRGAIADLLSKGTLPSQITERFNALTEYHISGSTLYRHRDLWHPAHLIEPTIGPVEIPPVPPQLWDSNRAQEEKCARAATSLLAKDGCNKPQDNVSSDLDSSSQEIGCNFTPEQLSIFELVQEAAGQEAIANQKRIRLEGQQQRHIERMQGYLDSGDPILVAEAIAWAQLNPGVLTIPPSNLPPSSC
ncbi:hypothetical protein NDI52_28030 [Leptolyngbya sp. PL-A3]|uniref:hypothetical protein n=1 Tax=Leptolyngbya sp. PL-A3 TaxID=2933911 RepID=UPI00329776A4